MPVSLLHPRLTQSSLQCTGMGIIPSVSQFSANIHSSSLFVTRISVYLKSIRTSKYALFEIKIFRNSDFAFCTKISVSKITRYTVLTVWRAGFLAARHTIVCLDLIKLLHTITVLIKLSVFSTTLASKALSIVKWKST